MGSIVHADHVAATKANPSLTCLAAVWLILAILGFCGYQLYENAPIETKAKQSQWPAHSGLYLAKTGYTLVMFAHPRCPCTGASVSELARLLARCPERISAYVLFLRPAGVAPDWDKSDLWSRCAHMPGVSVLSDDRGLESANFNATVSGETLVYAPDGRLIFSGGITASRGHEGDNLGRSAIERAVNQHESTYATTPTFGCSLLDRCFSK
ncbi:MAG TPA: hypothetical protein V6C69_13765 [Trichormus sp.]|jgi:hypothetical protein